MKKFLKNYYIVGGMPEAVQTWVDTHDYKEVEEVQERILKDYADDFGKHTTPETAKKLDLYEMLFLLKLQEIIISLFFLM